MFRDDKPLSAAGVSSAAAPFTVTFQPSSYGTLSSRLPSSLTVYSPSILPSLKTVGIKLVRLKLANNLLENVQIEGVKDRLVVLGHVCIALRDSD